MSQEAPKKKWYQSKIFMLAIVTGTALATWAATGFVAGNGVDMEQIRQIQEITPATADAIETAVDTKQYGTIFMAVWSFAVAALRWITKDRIA